MAKYVGRDVICSYAVGLPSVDPDTLTFARLGMMRTKGLEYSWDTADVTGDTSDDYTREKLATFKDIKFSGDGVCDTAAGENQADFEDGVLSPTSATNYQPMMWLKLEYPDKVVQGNFLISSFSTDAPYDDGVTFSFEAESNGAITLTRL